MNSRMTRSAGRCLNIWGMGEKIMKAIVSPRQARMLNERYTTHRATASTLEEMVTSPMMKSRMLTMAVATAKGVLSGFFAQRGVRMAAMMIRMQPTMAWATTYGNV